MRVLVTRPLADAERTAARLRALGHAPVVAPVLTIERTSDAVPFGAFDALIVTSANAVPALAELEAGRTLPVFAVGRRTAAAIAAAGFSDVRVGAGDARALVDLVRQSVRPGARLLHVAGRDRKPEPAASMATAGYRVEVWAAYAARAVERLPEAARTVLENGQFDAALHYSRRSAAVLLELAAAAALARACLALEHLCLSPDAAAPLREAGARRIIVAERPDEEALLAKIHRGGSRHAGRRNERPGSREETNKGPNEGTFEGTNPPAPVSLSSPPPSSSPPSSSPPEEVALTEPPPDLSNPRPRRTGPFREPPTIDLKATVITPDEPARPDEAKGEAAKPSEGLQSASASGEALTPTAAPEPVPSMLGESAAAGPSDRPGEAAQSSDTPTSDVSATTPGETPTSETVALAPGESPTSDAAVATPGDVRTPESEPAAAGFTPTSEIVGATPTDASTSETKAAVSALDAESADTPIPSGGTTPSDAPTLTAQALPTADETPGERAGPDGTGKIAPEDRAVTDAAEAQAAAPIVSETTPETTLAPTPVPETRRGPGIGALLGASLLGGLIGAGLTWAGDTYWRGSNNPNAQLETRLGQLEQRLGATAPRDALGALERRIAALDTEQKALGERVRAVQQAAEAAATRPPPASAPAEPAPASPTSTSPAAPAPTPPADDVAPRLGALETQVRDLTQIGNQVRSNAEAARATQQQLTTLDTQVRDLAQVRSQIQANAEAARGLTQRLSDQDQRLATLAKQLGDRNPADAINAGLRVVLADRLGDALRKSTPLKPALDVLRRLDVDPQALAALEPYAAQGAPSAAELARSFKPLGDRIILESRPPAPANPTWGDRLWSLADQVVTVRPASEAPGSDVPGLVARIQGALANGDLKSAATAWDALPESARRVSDEWGRRLKQRTAAETAAQTIADRALSALDASAR